jgi:uncharacterized protein YbaA (DUF1428 family)
MSYVMSYVGSVPNDRKKDYLKASQAVAAVFKEYGALRVVEAWGENIPEGTLTSFLMAVKAQKGETVVCGWQEWPDRATQEAAMEKAMQDPRMAVMRDIPIDGKRMIFGGFGVVVDL